jgi:hypothetical protein
MLKMNRHDFLFRFVVSVGAFQLLLLDYPLSWHRKAFSTRTGSANWCSRLWQFSSVLLWLHALFSSRNGLKRRPLNASGDQGAGGKRCICVRNTARCKQIDGKVNLDVAGTGTIKSRS